MRLYIWFFAGVFLSGCSNDQVRTKASDLDFVITYYSDSTVKEIVQKRNGLLEGKTFKFDEQGAKLWEFNYQNDQQEGMQFYYYNHGRLNFAVPYKNGMQHGWATRYTGPCGNISEEGQYENGEKNGLWYEYYDKELLEIGLYKNGSLDKIIYRNGKYLDRNAPLPPITKDCADQWRSGEE